MNIQPLTLDTELIPAVHPYLHLGHFNRVQSTLIRAGVPFGETNLVLGTKTSTGKTISAELFIHHELHCGRRVIYAAPMKALVNEKYNEWRELFPAHKVAILTGDFRNKSTSNEQELYKADIVVLTTEMLDSQTRGASRKDKPHWMHDIGLCILDEGHIIGSLERGVPGELGILRLARISKSRIVILSATLPNADEFAKWLYSINGLKTYVLNSDWRPVELEWKLVPIGQRSYNPSRVEMRSKAIRLIKSKPDEKFLVFAHEKKTGHTLLEELNKEGIESEFHRADLNVGDRTAIEDSFKSKQGLRVIVATTTLAWGVNLPAKNVIIMGTHRGLSKMDPADIIQMGGRAGRMGIDDKGTCYLMCHTADTYKWTKQINSSPRVESSLLDEVQLRFQLLAEIGSGVVDKPDKLRGWFANTLAGHQLEYPSEHLDKALNDLMKMGMLDVTDEGLFRVTPMGRVSTSLYIKPDDVYHWYRTMKTNGRIETDTQIAVLMSTPTTIYKYTPAEYKDVVHLFSREATKEKTIHNSSFLFSPYAIWRHLKGDTHSNQGLAFYVKAMVDDAERNVSAINILANILGIQVTKDLEARVRYGVPRQVAFLCDLPDIGAKRAFLLYRAGFTSTDKLAMADQAFLVSCLGPKIGNKLYAHIKENG